MKRIFEACCMCFVLFVSFAFVGCQGSHSCEYNETYSSDYKYHWFDSKCHSGDEYRLDVTEHDYTEFEALDEGGFARTCTVCGYEQTTPKNKYIVEEAENGTVEIVTESSGRTVFLPKPDDGYYFSHWIRGSGTMRLEEEPVYSYYPLTDDTQIQTVSAFVADDISTLLGTARIWVTTLKPVFINTQSTLIDVDVTVYLDSQEDADGIWFLPYCRQYDSFSYYVREGSNLIIEKEERISDSGSITTTTGFPKDAPYIGSVSSSKNNKLGGVNLYITKAQWVFIVFFVLHVMNKCKIT